MFEGGDKFQRNRWKKNYLEASKPVIVIFSLITSDLVCRYNSVLISLFLTSFLFCFFCNPDLHFLYLCCSFFHFCLSDYSDVVPSWPSYWSN